MNQVFTVIFCFILLCSSLQWLCLVCFFIPFMHSQFMYVDFPLPSSLLLSNVDGVSSFAFLMTSVFFLYILRKSESSIVHVINILDNISPKSATVRDWASTVTSIWTCKRKERKEKAHLIHCLKLGVLHLHQDGKACFQGIHLLWVSLDISWEHHKPKTVAVA